MIAADIKIQTLTTENIRDAFFLYKKVMKGSFTYRQFFQKYQTDYAGLPQCSQLAYFNGKPIAFYGAIPCFVKAAGNRLLATQVCDSFTLKEYRKQKINYKLAERCYELLRSYHCSFLFGFQNLASYSAAKKHDWHVANKILFRFHIAIHRTFVSRWIGKLMIKFGYRKKFERVFATMICNERDFHNILDNENGITVDYESGFLQYKTFTPNYFILIGDVKFWVNLKSYFEIGAIDYQDKETLHAALQKLIGLLNSLYISQIILNAPYNSRLYRDLCNWYEPHPSWIIGYLNFDGKVDGAEILVNPADFDTY